MSTELRNIQPKGICRFGMDSEKGRELFTWNDQIHELKRQVLQCEEKLSKDDKRKQKSAKKKNKEPESLQENSTPVSTVAEVCKGFFEIFKTPNKTTVKEEKENVITTTETIARAKMIQDEFQSAIKDYGKEESIWVTYHGVGHIGWSAFVDKMRDMITRLNSGLSKLEKKTSESIITTKRLISRIQNAENKSELINLLEKFGNHIASARSRYGVKTEHKKWEELLLKGTKIKKWNDLRELKDETKINNFADRIEKLTFRYSDAEKLESYDQLKKHIVTVLKESSADSNADEMKVEQSSNQN